MFKALKKLLMSIVKDSMNEGMFLRDLQQNYEFKKNNVLIKVTVMVTSEVYDNEDTITAEFPHVIDVDAKEEIPYDNIMTKKL